MTPERWQQVKSMLAPVLELDPAERSAYLDRACAGDCSLREEIETLLATDQKADPEFLNEPVVAALAAEGPDANLRIGRRIGPYQVVEEIGVGGMGEVYRAFRADDHYRKQVAIKLVRAGQDSKFVHGRFKNERQVLASLDHPNIARLLDGGTTEDGVPYFVMELIDGQPIHRYCDDHKLPTTERVALFQQVCSAVQYAHQRLIIHRDLKPSNILVTGDGTPKLLDFGIAKILDPAVAAETLEATISMFRLLTPGYASPEQIKGEAITTASDVYSLGVLLYELLTGCWPYQATGSALHEISQAVCDFEPERPSLAVLRSQARDANGANDLELAAPATVSALRDGSPEKLSKRLRGDLDNIILMALRKEPQRRYSSVEQFSTDLQRHLGNLPVTAARDTVGYRTSKFITRHKAGVAAAGVVVVTLLAGLAVTTHEARIAHAQQLRAEQRFNEVRELANSLMFDVHDSIQDLPGSTPARKLLVERALRYLDGLSRDSASDVSLQRELATAYEKVGTVQGNPFGANLGDTQGAFESYQRSLAIRETIGRANPLNVEDQVALARSQRMIAVMSSNRVDNQLERNMTEELRALATAERAFKLAPFRPAVLEELQANYDFLVTLRHYAGDNQGAWTYLQKERPIVEARLQAAPADRGLLVAMGRLEVKSGDELAKLGLRKEGQDHARHAIEILELASAEETDANAKRFLAYAYERFGDSLLMDSDFKGALQIYRKDARVLQSLLVKDPSNAVVQLDLGIATAKIGDAQTVAGNTTDGLIMLNRAQKMFQTQLNRDASYTEPRWFLGWSLLWTAEALGRSDRPGLAVENYRKVLSTWEGQDQAILQAIVAGIHVRIGTLLAKSASADQAAQEYQRALSIAEQLISKYPYLLEADYASVESYMGLGELSRRMAEAPHRTEQQRVQDWTEARNWYQRSVDAWQRIQNPGAITPMGFACESSSKAAEELADADAALAKLRAVTQ